MPLASIDQLTTPAPASPDEVLPPEAARRPTDRLEIRRTPKHGSWLDLAEIEFRAPTRDLPDRVGDRPTLERHGAAWARDRNGAGVAAHRRFTPADARIRLPKLYPTIHG
jgi:hypothetical protein